LRAAEQGDMRAQYNLGVLYRDSLGVERDTPAALAWFQKAAEQGDPQAQYNLGAMYETPGIDRQDLAIHWYRSAAAQGFAAAQFNLGVLYFSGKGVTADPVLGYALLLLADANAPEAGADGQSLSVDAAKSMQKEQVDAGRALSSLLQADFGAALDSYLLSPKTAL
jgi:TPR repeat protein